MNVGTEYRPVGSYKYCRLERNRTIGPAVYITANLKPLFFMNYLVLLRSVLLGPQPQKLLIVR